MSEGTIISFAKKLGLIVLEEYKFLQGVEGQVVSLRDEMEWIGSFLRDAALQRSKYERVDVWVSQIRDLSYDAEDVVDVFINKVKWKQERSWLRFLSIWPVRYPGPPITLHDLGNRIGNLNSRIERIAAYKSKYAIDKLEGQDTLSNDVAPPHKGRRTTDVKKDDIIGFDDLTNELVEKLLQQGESSQMQVLSIFGMAGVGKSTLARNVYDALKNKVKFNSCAWITVSQECESEILLKEFEVQNPKNVKFGKLLVVFNDVWSKKDWYTIYHDILGKMDIDRDGSIVLITSCSNEVAKIADSRGNPYKLKELAENQSIELLKKRVFPDPNNFPCTLETPAKEIVRKCGYLPLAIVILASLLSKKQKTFHVWNKVAQSATWQLLQRSNQCFEVLALNYDNLPNHLKPCFLYLGLFPRGFPINCETIIQLWIAEGFIQERGEESMEHVAEDYLEELIEWKMIEEDSRRSNGSLQKCRIHELLREFAKLKGQQEKFLDILGDKRRSLATYTMSRRLALHSTTKKSKGGAEDIVTIQSTNKESKGRPENIGRSKGGPEDIGQSINEESKGRPEDIGQSTNDKSKGGPKDIGQSKGGPEDIGQSTNEESKGRPESINEESKGRPEDIGQSTNEESKGRLKDIGQSVNEESKGRPEDIGQSQGGPEDIGQSINEESKGGAKDIAIHSSKKESKGRTEDIGQPKGGTDIPDGKSLNNPRSIMCFTNLSNTKLDKKSFFKSFRYLRVLDLQAGQELQCLSDAIGKLVLLKYLKLRGAQLKKLPSSMRNLRNLQTLDISETVIVGIPPPVWELVELRHFYSNLEQRVAADAGKGFACDLLNICHGDTDRQFGRLRNLVTLSTHEDNWKWDEFCRLTNLRKLELTKANFRHGEVLLSSILEFIYLQELDIEWDKGMLQFPDSFSFSYHVHLYKMRLSGEIDKLLTDPNVFPPNLSELELHDTTRKPNGGLMKILAALNNLQFLQLRWRSFWGEVMVFPENGFPNLTRLDIGCLLDLKKMEIKQGSLPKLEVLNLCRLDNLRDLPEELGRAATLKKLRLICMPSNISANLGEGTTIEKVDNKDLGDFEHLARSGLSNGPTTQGATTLGNDNRSTDNKDLGESEHLARSRQINGPPIITAEATTSRSNNRPTDNKDLGESKHLARNRQTNGPLKINEGATTSGSGSRPTEQKPTLGKGKGIAKDEK